LLVEPGDLLFQQSGARCARRSGSVNLVDEIVDEGEPLGTVVLEHLRVTRLEVSEDVPIGASPVAHRAVGQLENRLVECKADLTNLREVIKDLLLGGIRPVELAREQRQRPELLVDVLLDVKRLC